MDVLERAVAIDAPLRTALAEWVGSRTAVLAWWAGSRAVVFGSALVLHLMREPRGYFGPAIFRPLFGPLEAWDGIWYRLIAVHGYLLVPGRQSDPAFFPLYPLLLKLVGATGIPIALAGLLLSNVLFLAALLAFDALSGELFDRELARRATLLLAVFPTTYVCSMVYPESLVLLAYALTGLFAVRGRWGACAIAAAVAALARPEGVLLALPILGCLVAQWRSLAPEQRGRGVGALLAGPAAALSYPLYLGWALHDPLAWSKAQTAWGRSFRLDGLYHAVTGITHELASQAWPYRDVLACLLALVLLGLARRAGVPWGWIALGVATVLLPLGSGSFESDARFALPALPIYWTLARLSRSRRVFSPVAAASLVLLAAGTVTLPLVFP
jgi:Dolichyl-phosphate-mannose-protein mannosyltransferase